MNKEVLQDTAIESILITSKVQKIELLAFEDCHNLKRIEFNENSELESIDNFAFESLIESITIPSKTTDINFMLFKSTPKLKKNFVNENNTIFNDYENEFLIGKSDLNNDEYDRLVFASRNIIKATILSFIKEISSYSFSECKIESIEIPSNVTKIGAGAFFICKQLNQIEFENNSNLKMLTLLSQKLMK